MKTVHMTTQHWSRAMAEKSDNGLNKARETLVNRLIECLDQDKIPWEQSWWVVRPMNGKSNRNYNGINRLILNFVSDTMGYTDPRWFTFQEASKRGWIVNKGTKSTPVEYWYIWDNLTRKSITFQERDSITRANPDRERDMRLSCKIYNVFNAQQLHINVKDENGKIIGTAPIPAYKESEAIDISKFGDDMLKTLSNEMGVEYEEHGDSAYYNPKRDKVVLPPRATFKSENGFLATALHEFTHATGHPSRLDRDQSGRFGSEEYAREELVAEIGSSFVMQTLGLEYEEGHQQNHLAYVQSWSKILKDDPKALFEAIKKAEKAEAFLYKEGGLNHFLEQAGIEPVINSQEQPEQAAPVQRTSDNSRKKLEKKAMRPPQYATEMDTAKKEASDRNGGLHKKRVRSKDTEHEQ